MSSGVVSIHKDGDNTTSLGTIFPCAVNHTVKKGFSYVSVQFPILQLVPKKGHMLILFAVVRSLSNCMIEPNKATLHLRKLEEVLPKEINVEEGMLRVQF